MLTCISLLLLPTGIESDPYSNRYSVELGGLGRLSKPAGAGYQNRINNKLYIVQNLL